MTSAVETGTNVPVVETGTMVPVSSVTALVVPVDVAAVELAGDPSQYVVEACERAKAWLIDALEHGDLESLVEFKSNVEALRTYTRQKQLGKDAELSAAEIVRRAERGIGLAIRKGQSAGEIARHGQGGGGADQQRSDRTMSLPTHFATHAELFGNGAGLYRLADGVTDERFEEALADAKAESNLSRANVVRKLHGEEQQQPITDRPDVLRRTRRLDNNRIIEQTIASIEYARPVGDIYDEVDYAALDRDNLGAWIDSISESISALRSLKSRLEKESNRVRV